MLGSQWLPYEHRIRTPQKCLFRAIDNANALEITERIVVDATDDYHVVLAPVRVEPAQYAGRATDRRVALNAVQIAVEHSTRDRTRKPFFADMEQRVFCRTDERPESRLDRQ